MSELINLRTERKNKQRIEAEKQAEENRVKFGRSKANKKSASFDNDKFKASLDGKKLGE